MRILLRIYKRAVLLIPLMIVVALLLPIILPATPVQAIADPDSLPDIKEVTIYESCLEPGDVGVLVDFYIDYAVLPTETATQSYLVVFVDSDGVTQLGAVAPYAYTNKGYGRSSAWIYFTAAEVTAYGITSAKAALYQVWVVGNPTVSSGWPADPPKRTVGVSDWVSTDVANQIAAKVLYYATEYSSVWSLALTEVTAIGTRLSAYGQAYFATVISDLSTIAPTCFPDNTIEPTNTGIDYTIEFGAIMTNGTGTCVGSPIVLTEGANNVEITTIGTFSIYLSQGTIGTASTNEATVDHSPADLTAGTNIITVSALGGGTHLITVDVELETTQSKITDTITGTGFDLSTLATRFGLTTMMMSGLVWFVISILICSAVFKVAASGPHNSGAGKVTLIVFDICIIGGGILGFMPVLIAALLFIIFGVFTGYILFFKNANV